MNAKFLQVLLVIFLTCSAASAQVDKTATGTSVELQELILADESLKHAIDEVDPQIAIEFSDDSRQEIEEADAFCFDERNRVIMLWGSNFEGEIMIWGPGLRYSFLAEIKKGNISIERTSYVPKTKSTTVWTPHGKLKPSCNGKQLYRVVRTR